MKGDRNLCAALALALLQVGCAGGGSSARDGAITNAFAGATLEPRRDNAYPRSEYVGPYVVEKPPPLPPVPARDLVGSRPAREAIWVPGYHAYVGRGRYEWVPGHWEVPPARSRQFEQPRWERRGPRYVYVRAHWR